MTNKIVETHGLFYGLTFLSALGMGFVGSTYATFLTSHGLDRLAINLVNIFFMATLFVGELPTGALADVFGRKRACILAFIVRACGMIIYGWSHSFWAFVIAEIVCAVGLTFENGALQAWAVDRLNHCGGKHTVDMLYRRKAQLKLTGVIVGGLCGAFISNNSLALPWFYGAAVLLVTSCIAWVCMREEYFAATSYSFKGGVRALLQTMHYGLSIGIVNPAIQFLCITNLLFFFAVQAPNMFWQLYFKPHVTSQMQYGYIHMGALLAMVIGSTYALNIAARVGSERKTILFSLAYIGVWLAFAGVASSAFVSIPAFMLHEIGRGLYDPIKDKYLNAHIPGEQRATLDSFQSMTRHIGSVAGLFVSGIIATCTTDGISWIVSGIVLVIGAMAIYWRMCGGLNNTHGAST